MCRVRHGNRFGCLRNPFSWTSSHERVNGRGYGDNQEGPTYLAMRAARGKEEKLFEAKLTYHPMTCMHPPCLHINMVLSVIYMFLKQTGVVF